MGACPCGFDGNGLPVGLQIVGKPQDDVSIIQLAHQYETFASQKLNLRMNP
jgi:Asp-tRNA(Asn)/Glu-tRNA(Gln) amidotransferase A subunit family amidase